VPLHNLDAIAPGSVVLLGVPCDENSSLIRGPAAGPAVIRSALFDPELNLTAEDGRQLHGETRLVDAGDLRLPEGDPAQTFESIVAGAAGVLERGGRIVALGGDHSVIYPLVHAAAAHLEPFNLLQVDAHPDLYEDFEGNRFSHASGVVRIMEAGHVSRAVQVGIRAATPHQRRQAERYGVQMLPPFLGEPPLEALPGGPVYLSLDLDGIDPAFAPGVSHPEAGGLTVRQVLAIIQQMPGPLIGADVVEFNPRRDIGGLTALAAGKLVKEIVARMLRDNP
jgi:agmatinase